MSVNQRVKRLKGTVKSKPSRMGLGGIGQVIMPRTQIEIEGDLYVVTEAYSERQFVGAPWRATLTLLQISP